MTDESRLRRFGSYALRGLEVDNQDAQGVPVLTEKGSTRVSVKHPKAAAQLKALRRRRGELAATAAAPEPRVVTTVRASRDGAAPTAVARSPRVYAGHED